MKPSSSWVSKTTKRAVKMITSMKIVKYISFNFYKDTLAAEDVVNYIDSLIKLNVQHLTYYFTFYLYYYRLKTCTYLF